MRQSSFRQAAARLITMLSLLALSNTGAWAAWSDNQISDIIDKVDDIADTLANARDMANRLTESGLRQQVIEQLDQIKDSVDEQGRGFNDFVDREGGCEFPSECQDFRENLTEIFSEP